MLSCFLFLELQDPDAQMVAFFLLWIQRLNVVAVCKLIVLVRTDGRTVPGLYADERSLTLWGVQNATVSKAGRQSTS